jgi:hypothetical protein
MCYRGHLMFSYRDSLYYVSYPVAVLDHVS